MSKEKVVTGGESEVNSVWSKVDEWLAGIEATRQGFFDRFVILGPDGHETHVTPENADKTEADIRNSFAEVYPDLAPESPETTTQ